MTRPLWPLNVAFLAHQLCPHLPCSHWSALNLNLANGMLVIGLTWSSTCHSVDKMIPTQAWWLWNVLMISNCLPPSSPKPPFQSLERQMYEDRRLITVILTSKVIFFDPNKFRSIGRRTGRPHAKGFHHVWLCSTGMPTKLLPNVAKSDLISLLVVGLLPESKNNRD